VIRPTLARVDLSALQANLRAIVSLLDGRARVIAVVKANAYGHGAARVGLALEAAGADLLACADIEEGVLLREAGVRAPILIFGALSVSDLAGIFDYQLGFRHDNLARTLPEIAKSPNLDIVAVYTHFATADNPDTPFMNDQRERFDRAQQTIVEAGLAPAFRHAANSAALLRDERAWYDFVRPGLLLYGLAPPPLATTVPLRPALTLVSRVVAVKGMRPGEGTGYGLPTRMEQPTSIAVVPAGYADGLDTRLAGRGAVLVRGRRAPVVGSVCMDMITIDVTGFTGDNAIRTGDEVVIIGPQGDDRIDVREMAATIGTIPYEVLCRIGTRIQRVYT
jgi:alanine racemase